MANDLTPLLQLQARIEAVRTLSGPATAQALLRVAALSYLDSSLDRIFNRGIATRGNDIGTYTPAYLRKREKKGYSSSRRVVLEFTGQMRRDYTILPITNGWGTGFQNAFNADKARWAEETYERRIFGPTPDEVTKMRDAVAFTAGQFIRTGRTEG